ncbi:MAG: hypothetical protein AB7U71_02100, partial [Comamonas sp.]
LISVDMISQIRNIDWIYFITDPIISPFPSTEALHAPHSLARRLHAGHHQKLRLQQAHCPGPVSAAFRALMPLIF